MRAEAINDRLSEAAAAVADGRTLDWDSLESGASHEDRLIIRRLRVIAEIGRSTIEMSLTGTISDPLSSWPSVTASLDLQPSTFWGSLRILGKIGAGRFGVVYRAWDPALDRDVALKILREADSDEAAAKHVIEEGRLMARVRHPNVVTIHGAQRIAGTTGLWMEFVSGRSLAAELADTGTFEADELARVGIEISRALAAVHGAGLVHRDVKAQNVLRDTSGRVVLGDFGTGRELETSAPAGSLAGTPSHLAPELFASGTPTPCSDIYSLGVLLFHLATRAYPVVGRSLRDLADAHAQGRRTTLSSLRPDLPQPLTCAIEKALNPEPTGRFESAESLERALQACIRPAPSSLRSRARLGAVAAALILAAVVSAFAWRTRPAGPPIPFSQRDWVLVTAFENRTGEPALDGALEYALERELSNTSFVNVVPRSRIDDTLRLMRKPLETRMDEIVGREVAIRDGQIRALIAGRVEKIGGVYSMSARILRPADGSIAGSVNEASLAQPDLLGAVRRIAAGVRAQLGEDRPEGDAKGVALQKVATQSMRALQLYSKARAMGGEGILFSDPQSPKAVEKLLDDALSEDPDFVWALILQAHAIDVQGRRNAEVISLLERAVAASVPGVDRYIAEAELDAFRGNFSTAADERVRYWDLALVSFDAALQLQPDHYWALSCVLNIRGNKLARPVPAHVIKRFVELRPNNLATYDVASRHAFRSGHIADAREYAKHGRALVDLRSSGPFPFSAVKLIFFPVLDAWHHHLYSQALLEADIILANPGLASGDLLSVYLALGRWERAEQVASLRTSEVASRYRILIAKERGDRDGVRRLVGEHLAKLGPVIGPNSLMAVDLVMALLEARMFDEAHLALAKMKQSAPVGRPPELTALVEGLITMSAGRYERAIPLFEEVLGTLESRSPLRLRASLKLAEAWAAKGDLVSAIAILETASLDASRIEHVDPQYPRLRDRLAQIYRRAGRPREAQVIEADLRQILAGASDDHPIKRRLTRLEETSAPLTVLDTTASSR